MPQRLQDSTGVLDGRNTFGVHRVPEEDVTEEEPDMQTARITANFVAERAARRWRNEDIAGHGSRDCVEDRGRVPHRPSKNVLADIPEEASTAGRTGRHTTT